MAARSLDLAVFVTGERDADREEHAAPLTTLLSCALVAYTIEFDNEFELRMPHRTTAARASAPRGAPWLVSRVMWETCVRHLAGGQELTVADLEHRARARTNLDGMRRWGYIAIDERGRTGGAARVARSAQLRLTRAGVRAHETWVPLDALIEARWRDRFGPQRVNDLRAALTPIADGAKTLPDCLPILAYGLFSPLPDGRTPNETPGELLPLAALLSRALLAIAVTYERDNQVSLAVAANLLRIVDERGTRQRDLPALTGTSKEACAMALSMLVKANFATLEADRGEGRYKDVRLTPAGRIAQGDHRARLAEVEAQELPDSKALRAALEPIAGDHDTLALGLEPHPDSWRRARPRTLPHFPMILHRGGFPDGS